MKLPQYADIRLQYPWLPSSGHLYAIRGLQYMDDGSAVITLALVLPEGVLSQRLAGGTTP